VTSALPDIPTDRPKSPARRRWVILAAVVVAVALVLSLDGVWMTPFHPGSYTVRARTTTGVLMVITPHRAGTTHVDGSDVSYWHGVRHGGQHVGFGVVLNTK
jgi:hypothetical protein